jgi:hypothetical protein
MVLADPRNAQLIGSTMKQYADPFDCKSSESEIGRHEQHADSKHSPLNPQSAC